MSGDRFGLTDRPDMNTVFIVTPLGEEPKGEDLSMAAEITMKRGAALRLMCVRIETCELRGEHTIMGDGVNIARVDDYHLACVEDCPMLVDDMMLPPAEE